VNVGTKVIVINGEHRANSPLISAPAALRR
jgi:hypothetical protein